MVLSDRTKRRIAKRVINRRYDFWYGIMNLLKMSIGLFLLVILYAMLEGKYVLFLENWLLVGCVAAVVLCFVIRRIRIDCFVKKMDRK